MDFSQAIRTAFYQAISTIQLSGKVIPVFDGNVDPSVLIPVINGASAYIILQDQQDNLSPNQTMCNERILSNITIRIVTKFNTAGATDRTVSESISTLVQSAIRTGRNHNLTSPNINIEKVAFPTIRNVDEFGSNQTAFSKVLIYSITSNN